ncbi:hypothetical protein [Aequorivita antarctica]|uniref:hypothetical protein n=1 Tax=Aequorivita antarctica TaxID=153266 RepID=UPI0013589EDC|nr:hypothetical protein [Aequorivita antarctica]
MLKKTNNVPITLEMGINLIKKPSEKIISKMLTTNTMTETLLRMLIDLLADKYHLK